MAYVVEAIWRAREGEEETVLDALRELAPASRNEPGCRFYQVFQPLDEPLVFRLFEIYDDEKAYVAHGDSDHFRRFALERAIPVLESRERAFFQTIDV